MFITLITALMMQAAEPQPANLNDAPRAESATEATAGTAESVSSTEESVEEAIDPAAERAAVLSGINAYLNSIDTMRARFFQVSPQGQVIGGLLSIDRPGRLRFEYDDPSTITVIADGTTVALEDEALETVDRAPLRSTPLWWLLKDEIDIAVDAEVVDITREFGFTFLTVRDPNGEMEGQIQFVFEGDSYQLREWFVTDALGEITRIIIEDQEVGMELSPRLFIIPEPESRRESRRGRGRG